MRFIVIGLVLSILGFVPQFAAANIAPVADANGPYEETPREPIIFDGSDSSDADGDFLTYNWDFGDGATGTGTFSFHAYAAPGTYIVSLVVNDGTNDSTPATTEAVIGLAPPNDPVSPEDEASSVAFPLILEWEETLGAESYFYNILGMEEAFLVTENKGADEEASGPLPEEVLEFLSPKSYEEYRQQCEETKGKTCSDENIQRTIVEAQTYSWRVKACTVSNPLNPNDVSCGPYSRPLWDFVYIPQSPENLEQPSPGSSGVTLPVKLEWTKVENVGSYVIDIRLDIGCNIVDNIVGFFIGGDCDPLRFFIEPILGWFGFGENYDPSCPWNLWNKNTEECVPLPILPRLNNENPSVEELTPKYQDAEIRSVAMGDIGKEIEGQCIFSKNVRYKVTIASCLDKQAQICGEWSDEWKFSTGANREDGSQYKLLGPIHIEPAYELGSPLPIVGKSDSLQWKAQNCVSFVRLFVTKVGGPTIISETLPNFESVELSAEQFENLWNDSSALDKEYVWNLQPCWRIEDDINCESGVLSTEWHFKTIGEPPLLETPNNGKFIKVPSKLTWQRIDGVGSYLVQTAKDEDFKEVITEKASKNPSFTLSIDDFKPDRQYWWRIASCADENGDVCGEDWSEKRMFRTYPLLAPTNPEPPDETEFSLPGTLGWNPDDGANYYQYQVRYTDLKYGEDNNGKDIIEERPACTNKVGDTVIPQPGEVSPITSQPTLYLSEYCKGEYEWLVLSCADKDCEVTAPTTTLWTFTAIKQTSEEQAGLIPCGKTKDSTSTPFDETEPCQLKHAGFLLQNILDFVLWKLSLIVLAVLAVFVAASTYFSFGSPNVITRIRSIFRSYFYGVLILLFAWAIVNIVMAVFGFDIEFFGRWYEIPF